MSQTAAHRHPATVQLVRWFAYDHLREGLIRDTSALFAELADDLLEALPDGPELSAGLRHLLQAKDCCVRQAVDTVEAVHSDDSTAGRT